MEKRKRKVGRKMTDLERQASAQRKANATMAAVAAAAVLGLFAYWGALSSKPAAAEPFAVPTPAPAPSASVRPIQAPPASPSPPPVGNEGGTPIQTTTPAPTAAADGPNVYDSPEAAAAASIAALEAALAEQGATLGSATEEQLAAATDAVNNAPAPTPTSAPAPADAGPRDGDIKVVDGVEHRYVRNWGWVPWGGGNTGGDVPNIGNGDMTLVGY
jgi:hypothetical protein